MVTILLRILHVVTGALWVGAVFVVTFFLLPSIRASGPSGGVVMRQLVGVRKLPIVILILGWISILSGLTLYLRDSMGGTNGWNGSPTGIIFGIGGLLGLIGGLVGTFWTRPVATRMAAVGAELQGAGTPPPANLVAEMARLQESTAKASKTTAFFLIGAVFAMSIARYM